MPVESINKLQPSLSSAAFPFKERAPDYSSLVDDEFNNKDIPHLEPFKKSIPVKVKHESGFGEKVVDLYQTIARDFAYLSRTADLEVGTEKVKVLQDIVDKFTAHTGVKARVAIMNKGTQMSAFTSPDGTIFLSQYLINFLDSEDETAAVLAHEMGHLIYKSAEKEMASSNHFIKFGTGWIHEMASDLNAPRLLEVAKYNSLAFASAIERVSGAERGIIHQGGLARASESIGLHMSVDFATSSVTLTPKPEVLRGEIKKTNTEIVSDMIWKNQSSNPVFAKVIEKLHPRDLEEAYGSVLRRQGLIKRDVRDKERLNIFNNLLRSRLKGAGYDDKEIKFFLIADYIALDYNTYLIENPEETVEMAKQYAEFMHNPEKLAIMHDAIFEGKYTGVPSFFLHSLHRMYLYDQDYPDQQGNGVPITEESLLDSLQIISNAKRDYDYSTSSAIKDILFSYLRLTYLKNAIEAGKEVDADQIRAFWQEVRERGINTGYPTRWEIKDLNNKIGKRKESGELANAEQSELAAMQVFCDVFGVDLTKKETIIDFAYIDNFFTEIGRCVKDHEDTHFIRKIQELGSEVRSFFDDYDIQNEKRLEFVHYISEKIGALDISTEMYILDFLAGRTTKIDQAEGADKELNNRLMQFNLRSFFGISLFQEDCNEFYSYMEDIMNQANIDTNALSRIQLANLTQGLLETDRSSFDILLFRLTQGGQFVGLQGDEIKVKDFNRFFQLPFVKALREKKEQTFFTSFKELREELEKRRGALLFNRRRDEWDDKSEVFQDTMLSLIMGEDIRRNLLALAEKELGEQDLDEIFQIVELAYPRGYEKQTLLSSINRKYLSSATVPLEEKIDYLIANFDLIGLEGMVIVAEFIEDIDTYVKFREKIGQDRLEEYLSGSRLVSKAAAADLASSFFSSGFDQLLNTARTDPQKVKQATTDLAKRWLGVCFYHNALEKVDFYKKNKKIDLAAEERDKFLSFSDVISSLEDMSPFKRFIIAHKALTEVNGALANETNRQILSAVVLNALGLKDGFIASALKTACETGDGKIIAFPTAQIIAPLLFRVFDKDSVNYQEVLKDEVTIYDKGQSKNVPVNELFKEEDLRHILGLSTRKLFALGLNFGHQPDSFIFDLAQESDRQFHQLNSFLKVFLTNGSISSMENEKKEEIDPALEAVVSGVEASGALGVRGMQLANQFERFPPKVARRLENCFDNTSILDKKLAVWENLYKYGLEDPNIADVLKEVKLYERIGGGSLQSAWRAEYRGEAIVLKVLTPNAEAFIDQRYELAEKVFNGMRKRRSGKITSSARKALALIKLSRDWCKRDINDPTYEQDDDIFKTTIAEFDQSLENTTYYAPERRFTFKKLKGEVEGSGSTLNKVLSDDNIPLGTKQEVLRSLSGFFLQQMKRTFTDESGEAYHLFHSDPHVGNYLVSDENGRVKVGVIDRHMYIKLKPEDVKVLEVLLKGGNDNEFVYSFAERILDINQAGGMRRRFILSKVLGTVAKEYMFQKIRGKIDRLALLESMLTKLSNQNLDVPLELRLMIRNIGALKELMDRYGLELNV